MHSLLRSFFLLALVALALAAPTPRRSRTKFRVDRVPNPNYGGRNATRELVKSLSKYGYPYPDSLNTALASINAVSTKQNNHGGSFFNGFSNGASANNGASNNGNASGDETGEASATPVNGDVEFLVPVDIGGQTLNMDFDTGSSDLWVFSTSLPANEQQGHTLFDPQQSQTFQLMKGASFSISYGDGSNAAGAVGTDTVNIGGATVTSQAVEIATAVSQAFVQDTANSGLLGLAFSQLNTVQPQQQKTFFDSILDDLDQPVFTADLRHNAVGAYEFGTIDETKFSGQLAFTPIDNSNGFWQFTSSSFSVGNGNIMTLPTTGQAIADTGTTLMLVDPAIVNAYYSQVAGAVNNDQVGGVTFPCDSDLPDLSVDIGGNYQAVIPGSLINFTNVDQNTCFGGVQATTGNLQIYGDILFKAQFVVFDGGNNSIGMAPHA
ncbi:penicillopepsin [Xylogone sp. PMI_703]|nr:penicillopepsin [Xylogone sp. PMI_703]